MKSPIAKKSNTDQDKSANPVYENKELHNKEIQNAKLKEEEKYLQIEEENSLYSKSGKKESKSSKSKKTAEFNDIFKEEINQKQNQKNQIIEDII